MRIHLEVIRPIHITDGSVGTYSGVDYLFDANTSKVYILNLDKILSIADSETTNRLIEILDSGDVEGFRNLLRQKFGNLRKVSDYEVNVDDEAKILLTRKAPEILPYIKTIVGGSYGVYIPGTSLKGALRTAIIYSSLKRKINWNSVKRDMQRNLPRDQLFDRLLGCFGMRATRTEKYYETYQFKKGKYKRAIDMNKDPFSLIHVSDSNIRSIDLLVISRIRIIDFINSKEIELLAELIKEKAVFEAELKIPHRISTSRFANSRQFFYFKLLFGIDDLSSPETVEEALRRSLANTVNDFSRDVINYDRKIISEISQATNCNYCQQYLKELDAIEHLLEACSNGEFILPIGRFTGSISKSLFILFVSYSITNYAPNMNLGRYLASLLRGYYKNMKQIFPVSRRFGKKLTLVGWIRGKIL